jgi:hypothetical protein
MGQFLNPVVTRTKGHMKKRRSDTGTRIAIAPQGRAFQHTIAGL